MPIAPTFPGVYIEEVPSGVRTITGVATSIAAFVGFFKRGPLNKAVQVFSFADFDREFGGLEARSEASYAIQQFFLNGGTEAWVVRTASGVSPALAPANVQIQDGIAGTTALTVTAKNPGVWGNSLRVSIDFPAPTSGSQFNMTISLFDTQVSTTVPVTSEVFRGLSMTSTDSNFVDTVVNDEFSGSKLVSVTAAGSNRPLQTGTLSGDLSTFPVMTPASSTSELDVTIESEGPFTAVFSATPTSLAEARGLLEAAIRAANPASQAFSQVRVSIVDSQLRILAGPTAPESRVTFAVSTSTTPDITTLDDLILDTPPERANVQLYALGAGLAVTATAQGAGTAGADGSPPDPTALIGDLNAKTGIHALEDVDLFNILCLPRAAAVSGPDALTPTEAAAVIAFVNTYCEQRRAFFILDTPNNRVEVQEIKDWLDDNATLRHKNAALYFPRVQIPDPLNGFRLRSVGASGTIAGLFARIDATRGVWKAPAGTEATLTNVQQFDFKLTDPENGTLNPLGINALRNFPVFGNVAWGARTLEGSDQQASEWKYVPVRRLALFIEESLFRGTQFVVFEPNDEPLWAQIRLNVGAFMQNLFRQGAFQGTTPKQAYFVKVDSETTTQNDIDLGIVNIVVGFAPLKPAEFVIIKIQQIAGQIEV